MKRGTVITVRDVCVALLKKWPEIVGVMVGGFVRWVAIGATFHLGWRLLP